MNRVDAYFAEKDFTVPTRTRMVVRSKAIRVIGPHLLVLESSCSNDGHIAGSARVKAYDARVTDGDGPRVKRFGVDTWDEALNELQRLVEVIR